MREMDGDAREGTAMLPPEIWRKVLRCAARDTVVATIVPFTCSAWRDLLRPSKGRASAPRGPKDAQVFARAARQGSVDLVAWLKAQGCHWDADTCACAAEA
jgi:hypothetical protein